MVYQPVGSSFTKSQYNQKARESGGRERAGERVRRGKKSAKLPTNTALASKTPRSIQLFPMKNRGGGTDLPRDK